jgi:hypothetical protein
MFPPPDSPAKHSTGSIYQGGGFEWILGLKINFHKSEVYVFGGVTVRKKRGWPICLIAN